MADSILASKHTFDVPNVGTFVFDGQLMHAPNGVGIHVNTLSDIEYWQYIHQGIGYSRGYPPTVPKHPAPDTLKEVYYQLDYLIDLHESHRRTNGIGHQGRLPR